MMINVIVIYTAWCLLCIAILVVLICFFVTLYSVITDAIHENMHDDNKSDRMKILSLIEHVAKTSARAK